MGKHGCNLDGYLNATSFAKPMPAMVLYAAGASLTCFHFMFIDLITGFRHQSMTVPATRQVLDRQYRVKLKDIDKLEKWGFDFKHLKAEMTKLWAMVHASSPQRVFGRFPMCTAAGFLNLLAVVIFVEAVVRSFVPGALNFCKGTSDYGLWSISTVFGSQTLAVLVGSYAPLLRRTIFAEPVHQNWWKPLAHSFRNDFLQFLDGLKDQILKLFHLFKNPSLTVLTERRRMIIRLAN